MNRRNFLKISALTTGALALASTAIAKIKSAKPNVLIIHTDQQSWWTVGAYGGTLVKTPHIDSLADEGAIFKNFFTNSALCTPSRGAFLTGKYPHANGAYTNDIPLNPGEKTFASYLQSAGYETGYAGKFHLAGKPKPGWVVTGKKFGFADSRYLFNRGHWKKIDQAPGKTPRVNPYHVIGDKQSYTTDWLTQKTLEFISQKRSKPFCFMVSIPDPHGPYTVRKPYDKMFDPKKLPLPESYFKAGKNRPDWVKPSKRLGRKNRENKLRKFKSQYLGEVACIDENVGKIIARLKKLGIYDNTILVFTTDHGEYMGEHGMLGKNSLYETAYRIPFIVRYPAKIKPGTVVNRIASVVDFAPGLLALAGVKTDAKFQGERFDQLLPATANSAKPRPDECYIHCNKYRRAGIFTADYELAFVKTGGHILFDRKRDPQQMNNLYGNPKYAPTVKKLYAKILAHNRKFKTPMLGWLGKIKL